MHFDPVLCISFFVLIFNLSLAYKVQYSFTLLRDDRLSLVSLCIFEESPKRVLWYIAQYVLV